MPHICAVDNSGEIWSACMDSILARSVHIVTLRGAGSFNGISVADANRVLSDELFPKVEALMQDGYVTIIYDGDEDNPEYPDIGHIMGRLRDHFDDRVGVGIDFYAVQMLGWYNYADALPKLRPLHSARGNEYNTVLFPDKTFPGEHDYFSQHERLVRSRAYEQWYIGACGLIATKQLADYSIKATKSPRTHWARLFRLPVSVEQEAKMRARLASTEDSQKRAEIVAGLDRRRELPYGLLYSPSGEFEHKPEYGIHVEVVT